MTRQIEWPETTFHAAAIPGADRDAVILLGVEPNYRWRAFNELVVGLARDLGVELVVTLGALLADVPHTRPAPVTGAASDLSLVEELGLQPSRYEGPTGIVGVLHDACRAGGDPLGEPLVGGAALRLARAEPAGRQGALRPPRRAARGDDRPGRARGGRGDLRRADHGGRCLGSRDGRLRRGARAAGRHDRRADGRRRSADGRVARRRADAVPARPRERRPTGRAVRPCFAGRSRKRG